MSRRPHICQHFCTPLSSSFSLIPPPVAKINFPLPKMFPDAFKKGEYRKAIFPHSESRPQSTFVEGSSSARTFRKGEPLVSPQSRLAKVTLRRGTKTLSRLSQLLIGATPNSLTLTWTCENFLLALSHICTNQGTIAKGEGAVQLTSSLR